MCFIYFIILRLKLYIHKNLISVKDNDYVCKMKSKKISRKEYGLWRSREDNETNV